jgi:light-regulated signal transduction histidine kinase (bacteriophytochrome)
METESPATENERLKRERAEFEAFFYSTLHDLRAPLRAVSNLSQWIEEDLALRGAVGQGIAAGAEWPAQLQLLRQRAEGMAGLLDGLVEKARLFRQAERPGS